MRYFSSDHSHRSLGLAPRTIVSALVLLGAAYASADGSYSIVSRYDYAFDPSTLGIGTSFHDVEVAFRVGSSDATYRDLTVKTSASGGYPTGTAYDFYDTKNYPFLGSNLSEPVVKDSMLYGVLDNLPGDPAGQRHLVFFMNPAAAANSDGVPYEQIFATSAQPYQFTEDSVIDALLHVHRSDLTDDQKWPYYDTLYKFQDDVTRNANVGPGGTLGDVWFTPNEGFKLVTFSTGAIVGGGTNTVTTTFTPVPEPASFAVLGLGGLALLRRRRR